MPAWPNAASDRIRLSRAPGSPVVASSLHNLGTVADSQGDLAGAKGYYEQALAIQNKLAPGSLDMAGSLNNLGIVAMDRGDLQAAQNHQMRALAIYEVNRLDFAEAYLVAHAEATGVTEVVSFDRSIDRVGTVTRREP